MKNIEVRIYSTKDWKLVKTIDGFDSYSKAVEFAKQEAEWRGNGSIVETAWTDDVNNTYSELWN